MTETRSKSLCRIGIPDREKITKGEHSGLVYNTGYGKLLIHMQN